MKKLILTFSSKFFIITLTFPTLLCGMRTNENIKKKCRAQFNLKEQKCNCHFFFCLVFALNFPVINPCFAVESDARIDNLIRHLDRFSDKDEIEYAQQELLLIGSKSVPKLIMSLNDDNHAAQVLELMGPEIQPELIKGLKSENPLIRSKIISIIPAICDSATRVALLVESLGDSNLIVRQAALYQFKKLPSSRAIEALL